MRTICLHAFDLIIHNGIHQFVLSAAGTDRIDFDVIVSAFIRQRLGQGHDGMFGRAVHTGPAPGLQAGHARYVDDGGPAGRP